MCIRGNLHNVLTQKVDFQRCHYSILEVHSLENSCSTVYKTAERTTIYYSADVNKVFTIKLTTLYYLFTRKRSVYFKVIHAFQSYVKFCGILQ